MSGVLPRLGLPHLGYGIGLRTTHFGQILSEWPTIDWFEAITENFLDSQGRPRHFLRQVAERYPVVLHGVSLSIGSTDPLNVDYLRRLKLLATEVNAAWVSDHLCWTGVLGKNTHDLLPLPYTEDVLCHVVSRIRQVQDLLERPLILENPSTYVTFLASTMTEWEFLDRMVEQTGCGLLLDINNIFVSACNHDFDPLDYLNGVPWPSVVQMHLAGHTDCGTHRIDTHDGPVIDEVWNLYALAQQRTTGVSTLIEWDAKIPSFAEVHAEALRAADVTKGSAKRSPSPESCTPSLQTKRGVLTPTVPQPLHWTSAEVADHA